MCKNCQHFERGHWHKSVDPDEGDQLSGKCVLLAKVLQITNSNLWAQEYLCVMETFGCSMFDATQQ